MKSAATILCLFFCFYLLGGNMRVHAMESRQLQVAQSLSIFHKLKSDKGAAESIVATGKQDEEQVLLSIEDEEEDFSARKYTLYARYFLAFFRAFTPLHDTEAGSNLLLQQWHPSCLSSPKYILQRVLRL